MDREQKREFVAGLAQVFAETSMVVVARNQGLTVAEATDLRRRMRAAGATFRVTKNRLATLALEGTQFTGIGPMLRGPTALAWARDPVAVSKAAVELQPRQRQAGGHRRFARQPGAGRRGGAGARRLAEPRSAPRRNWSA